MKKFLLSLMGFFFLSVACAAEKEEHHMVKTEDFLEGELTAIGLPDYPPFSYYEQIGGRDEALTFRNIFLAPLQKFAQERNIEIEPKAIFADRLSLEKQILSIRSGESQLFLGAYSHTKLFTAIELIYPAVLSNPLHVITMPDTEGKIKKADDLKNLRGVRIKQEYFSDFVERKLKPLNLTSVETPYDAYEQLFTGQADYLIGSLYYNRIMASRLGIEQYLAFSQKPLLKIPLFIALSKLTPIFSEHLKFFQEVLKNPQFSKEVKEEILRLVEEERQKNIGVVPPAFAVKTTAEPTVDNNTEQETKKTAGKVIEEEVKEKTIDDVLDGI